MGSLQLDISVTLIDHMGSDLSVVNAARVSFANESQWARNDGLSLKDKDVEIYLRPM